MLCRIECPIHDAIPMGANALAMQLEFMPDAAGNALGIDQLVMILTGAEKIDDVSAFVPEEL